MRTGISPLRLVDWMELSRSKFRRSEDRHADRLAIQFGRFFFGWLRFCHGAVAPSGSPRAAGLWGRVARHVQRRQPHLLNLYPNWMANWLAAILQVSGGFVHDLVMFRKAR